MTRQVYQWRAVLVPAVRRSLDRKAPARRAPRDRHRASAAAAASTAIDRSVAPFRLDQWGRQFQEPGIAAALMLEFPERMKRSPLSHELLSYLPKATRLVLRSRTYSSRVSTGVRRMRSPTRQIASSASSSLGSTTGRGMKPWRCSSALLHARRTRTRQHVWRTAWVNRRWPHEIEHGPSTSGGSDEQSNVRRILAWVERSTSQDESDVRNEIRLLSLFLTTTNRPLRDRATRALVVRGSERPDVLV